MSDQKETKKEIKLIESSKLKFQALTKTGQECQDALIKLKPFATFLTREDPKFVEFMFAPLWESKFFDKRGEKIFITYSELLDKVLSTGIEHHERTIKFFVNLFLGDKNDDLKQNDQLTKTEQRLFPKIHYFLRSLRSKFLNIQSIYLDLILNSFPFTTVCTIHSFVCYFSNCSSIYLYENEEENRERVLWRLIERLININSYLQKTMKTGDEFLSRLFEIGLSSMFKFVNKISLRGDTDLNALTTLDDLRAACNQGAHKELFESLSSIFLQQIIKMDNVTSVNLVILYVCSLNEELCFTFLDRLWVEAFNVPNPKAASVNYFCSFLCAAKFLSIDTLINFMIKVAKKINNYLKSSVVSVEVDLDNFHKTLKKHKYFYALCNCLFKLICVRSDELTDRHVCQLSKLQVQKIITCSLNPLAVCPIEIVNQFANICKFYQLGLCNMILQRNRRTGLYDLLKKKDVKFKLVYPFNDLLCSYEKLSIIYRP